jgi:hypothetical protein
VKYGLNNDFSHFSPTNSIIANSRLVPFLYDILAKKKNVLFKFLAYFLFISLQVMCKFTIEYVRPHIGFTYLMMDLKKKMQKNGTNYILTKKKL